MVARRTAALAWTRLQIEIAPRGGREGGRRGSTASHSKEDIFLSADLQIEICDCSHDARQNASLPRLLCLFWSHPIGTRHELLGTRSREAGAEWRDQFFDWECRNERGNSPFRVDRPREIFVFKRRGVDALTTRAVFLCEVCREGKGNTSQFKGFCGNSVCSGPWRCDSSVAGHHPAGLLTYDRHEAAWQRGWVRSERSQRKGNGWIAKWKMDIYMGGLALVDDGKGR